MVNDFKKCVDTAEMTYGFLFTDIKFDDSKKGFLGSLYFRRRIIKIRFDGV